MNGKTAIVTGGGGAIGRAIGRRLAEEGAIVGLFDIDAKAAEDAARDIGGAGGRAYAHAVDIVDYGAVKAAVAELEAEAGPIHILVNNAGFDRFARFLETKPEDWEEIIAINLRGPLNLHHAVLPGMVERGAGKVVNIASDAARVGSSGEAVYSACKGGLVALTKTLARELATKGVCLNVVCPGPTETPLLASVARDSGSGDRLLEAFRRATPMRRLGLPTDHPGVVAFLASDEASFITGQVISVSGGLTMSG
ncbi:MAG: SDR family oxidoreductase [Kiloniellales bacterium]